MSDRRPAANLLESSWTNEQLSDRVVRNVYFSTAVSAGDWITIDFANTTYGLGNSHKKVPAAGGPIVGVAPAAVSAGEFGDVVCKGVVRDAYVDGAVVAGSLLTPAAVAGQAKAVVAATERTIGVALEADTANKADVYVGAV